MSTNDRQTDTTGFPKAGEIWRNSDGAIRHVRDVDDDSYSVTYSRPADGHAEWRSVLVRDWLFWVEGTNATRYRRAPAVPDKKWGYVTNG